MEVDWLMVIMFFFGWQVNELFKDVIRYQGRWEWLPLDIIILTFGVVTFVVNFQAR